MQLLVFVIVAICIAGSKTQEIAIGTNYLRTHANDSLSVESAQNAQIIELPPSGIIAINLDPSSTTTSTASTVTTLASKTNDDDNSSEHHDHEHKFHHSHEATISIDVHNILDLFKQQLHETEERLLAAIQHQTSSSSDLTIIPKSYRTADR